MASFLTNLLPSSGGAVDTTVNAAVDMAKASQRAFKRAADAKTWKQYAGRDEGPDGYKFGDLTKGIFQKTKKHIVTNVKHKIQITVQNMYLYRVKPNLTKDKQMPGFVRWAIHEVSDELWANVMLELPRSLDKMLEKDHVSAEDRAEERAHILALREGHLGSDLHLLEIQRSLPLHLLQLSPPLWQAPGAFIFL